jgi:uncharacterized membrane protein (DUF106 family)
MFPRSNLFNRKGKVCRRQETFGLKKKVFMLTILVLVSVAFLFVPVSSVLGQSPDTKINSLNPESGVAGTVFNVTLQGTVKTANGSFMISLNDNNNNLVTLLVNKTASGNNVNENFAMPSVIPGSYKIVLQDVNTTTTDTKAFHIAAEGFAAIPVATGLIMLVAVAISFANMGLNRLLITKMIGWQEYRSMQKEMSEYNSQRMAALRSKDTKTLERLKKKESQITAMQGKMFKPQLILIPITFIYLVIWPVLTGVFPFSVAYVPGLGAVQFFIWYLLCSFFFGTIASRVIGVTPIQ